MSVHTFEELMKHKGHKIVCVTYGNKQSGIVNVALECETCYEVLLDYDK
jgi:hypothetical protein